MKYDEWGAWVRLGLNQGLRDLDPLVVAKLHANRHALLSRLKGEQDELDWLAMGRVAVFPVGGRWSLGAVLLVGSLVFCGFWWQSLNQERQEEAAGLLEAKLLSAEIPPQEFAAQDFSEWLQQGH